MEPDKETALLREEAAKIAEYVSTDGWRWIKARFMEHIMDLQSVLNVDSKNMESAFLDMKARVIAVNLLGDIIRTVEGKADEAKLKFPKDAEEQKGDEIIKVVTEAGTV